MLNHTSPNSLHVRVNGSPTWRALHVRAIVMEILDRSCLVAGGSVSWMSRRWLWLRLRLRLRCMKKQQQQSSRKQESDCCIFHMMLLARTPLPMTHCKLLCHVSSAYADLPPSYYRTLLENAQDAEFLVLVTLPALPCILRGRKWRWHPSLRSSEEFGHKGAHAHEVSAERLKLKEVYNFWWNSLWNWLERLSRYHGIVDMSILGF